MEFVVSCQLSRLSESPYAGLPGSPARLWIRLQSLKVSGWYRSCLPWWSCWQEPWLS